MIQMALWQAVEWLRRRLLRRGGGRRIDFTPWKCDQCGRVVPSRWLTHGYGSYRTSDGEEDVTYTAHCPRCGWLVYET